MFRIGGDGEHGLGADFEHQVVDHALVLIRDVGDRLWQGEDQVEVADRQEFDLAFGKPGSGGGPLALWAVPISDVVASVALVARLKAEVIGGFRFLS